MKLTIGKTLAIKHFAIVALMLNLGAAGLYAQQSPIKMSVSGTAAPSTIDLQVGLGTSEYTLAGTGSQGKFTLRLISASGPAPQPPTCSGLYGTVLAGEGVFRFEDGSLMTVNVAGGSDCISFANPQGARCIRTLQILGGTGRFARAVGGIVTLTMDLAPVVPNKFIFFTVNGELAGAIPGVSSQDQNQNGPR